MLGVFVFYINKIFVEAAQIEPFQVKVKYKYKDLGVYASIRTNYTNRPFQLRAQRMQLY